MRYFVQVATDWREEPNMVEAQLAAKWTQKRGCQVYDPPIPSVVWEQDDDGYTDVVAIWSSHADH